MAIYVDDCIWSWRGRRWCHCVSDHSYEELHLFVARLEIPRLAFQGDHYDLDELRRAWAIAEGAVAVSARELLGHLRGAGLRRTRGAAPTPGSLGRPDGAE